MSDIIDERVKWLDDCQSVTADLRAFASELRSMTLTLVAAEMPRMAQRAARLARACEEDAETLFLATGAKIQQDTRDDQQATANMVMAALNALALPVKP